MAHLANPPGMGLNSYFDTAWAQAQGIAAARFLVKSSTSWVPTINTGVSRTINVSVGSAWCCGVYDVTDAVESVPFAANTGGSDRLDMLVARFNWAAGSVTFAVVQGTTAVPAFNTGTVVDPARINRIPGVQYDAVLAVVKVRPAVAVFQPADIVADLRVWGGTGGPFITPVATHLTLLDVDSGAEVLSVSTGLVQRVFSGVWTNPEQSALLVRTTPTAVGTSGLAEQRLPGPHNGNFDLRTGVSYELVAVGFMESVGPTNSEALIGVRVRMERSVVPDVNSPLIGDDQGFCNNPGASGRIRFSAGNGQLFQVSANDTYHFSLFGVVLAGGTTGTTQMTAMADGRGVLSMTLYARGPAVTGVPTI